MIARSAMHAALARHNRDRLIPDAGRRWALGWVALALVLAVAAVALAVFVRSGHAQDPAQHGGTPQSIRTDFGVALTPAVPQARIGAR